MQSFNYTTSVVFPLHDFLQGGDQPTIDLSAEAYIQSP